MNDKFLLERRPNLNQNFADRLYQRLSVLYPEKEVNVNHNNRFRTFKWQYALTILVITAVLLVTFSAPVRAKALALIRMVAGFNIQEQAESPIKDLIAENNGTVSSTSSESGLQATEESWPKEYPVDTKNLSEVLKDLPFEIGLPSWIPDGYSMVQNLGISTSKSWVMMSWEHPDLSEIELMIEKDYNGYNLATGEDSAEEISINGEPAFLIRGNWDGNENWDPSLGIVIGWKLDGRFYRLIFTQREPLHNSITSIDDMESKIKEMVRMAESIKQ